MENRYLKQFETLTDENLREQIYFVSGNEEIFWLAIEMFNRANIAWINGKQDSVSSACGKAAQEEIDGLIYIGFMDKAHKAILYRQTGLVAGHMRY